VSATEWRAVVFDLFGTLVPPFRKAEHIAAMRACSQILGLHEDLCHQHWVDSFPRRVCGGFESVGENFAWIGGQVGTRLGAEACAAAAARYACFTRAGLQPFPGVEQRLAALKDRGLRLGLLTNCAPDVPEIFPNTALGAFFEAAVFSCTARVRKPDPRAYELVLNSLGIGPIGLRSDPVRPVLEKHGMSTEAVVAALGGQLAGLAALAHASLSLQYARTGRRATARRQDSPVARQRHCLQARPAHR
jgi:putative hydrolase of the HAD superfamily